MLGQSERLEPPLASRLQYCYYRIVIIDHAFQTGSYITFRIHVHLMHSMHAFDTLSLLLQTLNSRLVNVEFNLR